MATMPLSEVKARLSEIAEQVAATHERIEITKNGHDHIVLLAAEDLESIEATLELLSDPAAQARLADSERDIERVTCSTSRRSELSCAGRETRRHLPGRDDPDRCSTARRDVAEAVAAACIEFLYGPLAENPYRVGSTLRSQFAGRRRAGRGEYRVRYRIDEQERVVHVLDIDHRRSAYHR